MRIPRFHFIGDDDGQFYAVAYVVGSHVAPSGGSKNDAFLVLYFSPSEGFTRFSFCTVSPEGDLLRYTRGLDQLDSAEYALLHAWRDEQVPMHGWHLFPSASIEINAFRDDIAHGAYETARSRVALILYQARCQVWLKSKLKVEPMFQPSESDFPPMADSPDDEEISRYIKKSFAP